MNITRDQLPERVKASGTMIPVMYNGEKRFITDVHYGNDTLCYLKDNNGVPVSICDLDVLPKWLPIIKAFKELEEHYCDLRPLTQKQVIRLNIMTSPRNYK